MRETINGADLRRMIISAAAAIEINKQALNELNVFPVPDGFQMLEAIADSADASWEEHDRRLK